MFKYFVSYQYEKVKRNEKNDIINANAFVESNLEMDTAVGIENIQRHLRKKNKAKNCMIFWFKRIK